MNESIDSGFLLPHNVGAERLAKQLGGESHCRIGESAEFSLRFFDSFDWRLHAAGLRCLQLRAPQGALVKLKPAEGGAPLDAVAYEPELAWPANLPDSRVRAEVARRLDMRVLLPLATVRGEATDLCVLNEDEKTVVRLQLLTMRVEAEDLEEARLRHRLPPPIHFRVSRLHANPTECRQFGSDFRRQGRIIKL
jgi:hypothetical protein